MQIFYTIISGVIVFILSQYILEFILKPLKQYKQTISKIDHTLKFYTNIIVNPPFSNQLPEDYLMAKNAIRKLSCDLEADYKALLIFKPKKQDISEATKNLIWLSNVIGHRDPNINLPLMAADRIDKTRKLLKISEL